MKKILVIAPKFYSYRETIVNQISKNGHHVHFFDDRPSNSNVVKILLRLRLNLLLKHKIKKHYEKIISNIKLNKYDIILFLNIEALDIKTLKRIKQIQPNTEFILYMWDSAKNKPNFPKLIPLFDRSYTFDQADTKHYKSLQFLPLFFSNEFDEVKRNANTNYDICFIGAGHGDRCKILSEIKNQCSELNLKLKYFIFFQSKILFFLQLLKSFKIINSLKDECYFKSISFNEINEIYNKSKVIIDISHTNQTGLTMRTIESLGLNQKLITTNKSICNYNFFDKNMIFILDKENLKLPNPNFFFNNSSYDQNIRKKYSLSSWLDIVIGKNE